MIKVNENNKYIIIMHNIYSLRSSDDATYV